MIATNKTHKELPATDIFVFAAGLPRSTTSIIAGVQGVKRTADLIPFCHPLPVRPCTLAAITTNT